MRRLAAVIVTLALGATLTLALTHSSAQGSSTARFDVIFDDARGLVGGQLVKIAGAKAGTILNVVVTPDFKARIEASVDSRFMPFHRDAACTIRPEGLIAENYVDCDPGTAASPPLKATDGQPPTVPVANTTEPVSLLDLFNIFNLPTRQRFTAIVNELGIGTAGRGADFNDILRRANPTLALARQVITILDRQRGQLGTIVDATDTIAAEAAGHTATLQNFLDRTAALASLTAAHRNPLSLAIARLPGLLAAARPSLAQLDTVAREGTPLVAQLHAAVPSLIRVQNDLGPFVSAARPALSQLGVALRKATPAVRHTTPLITTVRGYVAQSLPGTRLFARLASNLQQHGFVESFLGVVYYVTAALARFDTTSHMLAILLVGAQNGLCGNYATTPVAGCSAHYGSASAYTPVAARTARAAGAGAARPHGSARIRAPQRPQSPSRASAPSPPSAAQTATPTTPSATGAGAPAPAPAAPAQQTASTLQSLINYLMR